MEVEDEEEDEDEDSLDYISNLKYIIQIFSDIFFKFLFISCEFNYFYLF